MDGKSVLHHRKVYADFHPQEDISGKHIRHLCHNKACVNINHLRSGTAKDNRADSVRDGIYAVPVCAGEANGQARLTWAKVRELRKLRKEGFSLQLLASKYGVHIATISDAALGKTWKEK